MDSKDAKSKVSIMVAKSLSTTRSVANLGPKSMSRMRLRKQSFGFTGVSGVRPVEKKNSQIGLEYKRPLLLCLNTYQLEPHRPFNVTLVSKAAEELLDELFTGHMYNLVESPALALSLADSLMRRVKALNFNRYRILSVVTIMQKRAQCYYNAIAFMWDCERDNCVNLIREEVTAFVQVTVFGIYLD